MNDNATNENSAVRDVLAERLRQISEEGWTPEHDDKHSAGELSTAAACYICPQLRHNVISSDGVAFIDPWPWWNGPFHYVQDKAWYKPSTRRRDLVKAAALIIADIERIDRIQTELCPVCAKPFNKGDLCATDYEMGTCHAECLEDSPVVNLDTGEPTDGPIATYRYDGLDEDDDAFKSEVALDDRDEPGAVAAKVRLAILKPEAGK